MDVFISWSGSQSHHVAEALRQYLPQMINAVNPYLSSADIDAGARWATDIAGKLEQSRVGILCLTPGNLESIWIHFEAGALSKTLERTFVCLYLVGLEPFQLKGPLTQFQAKRANEVETRRLVETINAALGAHALSADHLAEAFDVWWPKLKERLDGLGEESAPVTKRSERDMLEELVALARRQARDSLEPTQADFEAVARHHIEGVVHRLLGEDVVTKWARSASGAHTIAIRNSLGRTIVSEFIPDLTDPAQIQELNKVLTLAAASEHLRRGPEPEPSPHSTE